MTIQLDAGIRLLSGTMFSYNDPVASDVKIDDIAAALSKICRFPGHLPYFYSVAQHAVNASYIVEPEFAFTALMHDTAEAFTNDLPTPLKHAVPIFKDLEVKIESAMSKLFGFQYPLPWAVKLADLQMLQLEKLHVKQDFSEWEVLNGITSEHLRDLVDLESWHPAYAEAKFLDRYDELRR